MSNRRAVASRSDEAVVRRASRRVAAQFALAVVIVAMLGIAGAVVFVLRRVPEQLLVFPFRDLSMTLGARDFLVAGIAGAAVAVIVASVTALILTRRAVRPLADALRLQRDFVSDASHELRTPLAVLDMRIQMLDLEQPSADAMREELGELKRDAERLNAVISDLLDAADLAQLEAPTSTRTNATDAVREAVDEMRVIASRRSVDIEYTEASPSWILVPAERIRRCLVILLDNAIRHSPPRAKIDVSVVSRHRRVHIRVVDQGTGIAGIDPSRVFDRFAHSHPAGDADAAGHGIGLALVKDTAIRYRGAVRLVSTSSTGTEFDLTFPRAPRSAAKS